MTRHRNPEETTLTTSITTDLRQLTGSYTIDPSHSRLGFAARHAMVTKVRGAFNEFEGAISFDGDNPANATAQVTIKVASIDTRNGQRDEHLRGNDFLAMESYPEITFVATELRPTEDGLELTGDLTIRGVTRQITIPFTYEGTATDPYGNVRVGFEGSTTINRKDFGVNFNAVLETGGVLVSDKVTLEFDISAVKSV
jgi:polyisoprenoid-binding protein YceI